MPEERKLVTILFADIVGSTALGFERDPEVMRDALARTFDAVRGVLEVHGGTVEKFIGDAVMAVFGVPTAHDDDADRAVRAAFALRDRVAELEQGGVPFQLRVGVNTGEAVAGTAESTQFLVTGPVVNVGARVQQAASPGEILVGALTARITRGGVEYAAPRRVDAKGAGRIEVYTARALTTATPEQHRGLEGLRAPLIGRDRELRLLREALGRVGEERAPSLVTVFGAAGAGKSRLMAEFTGAIDTAAVRIGRCLPYGEGITFYPVQQILRADAGIDLAAPRADALAKLRAAVWSAIDDAEEAERVARRLAVVIGLDEAPTVLPDVAERDLMEELRWGVRRYIERRASAALVLVFEDVHWAEQALLDLIEHLAEWSRAPVLIVCLARPDFRELRPTFGANAANSAAITLSPLGADDTHRLIGELLAIDALTEELRAEVVTRAEGNPLYVEEFLRTLIETGRIVERDGRWAAAGAITVVEIPPTLQGLITARLDRVSPEVKRVLQAASIVGRLFSTAGLTAIAGSPPTADLLREAARRDLIVEADERAPGEGRVHRFRHPLFREVAYATISKADRLRMHDNYGRWLEATLGDRAEELREVVGYHAEQAYLYATDLGRPAKELGARALTLLVAAADRARDRFDQHAAWKLYERATAIADAIGVEVSVRAHVRGYALLGQLAFVPADESADRALEEAIALARSAGPSRVLVTLLDWYARDAFNRKGDTETAKRIAAELPDLAHAIGDADQLAETLSFCGLMAYWWNDRASEERFYLAAVEAGRRGSRARSLRQPLSWLARRACRFEGDFQRAAEYERQLDAIPVGTSLGERNGAERRAFEFTYFQGAFNAAVEHASKAVGFSRELGAPFWIAYDEWILGDALLALGGQDARAREVLEHGAETMERLQYRGQIPELRARAAIACLRLGDLEAARRHIAAAKAAVLPLDIESQRITMQAEAQLRAVDGDVAGAEAVMHDALTRVEALGYRLDAALLRIAFGEILLAAGRATAARDELAKARAFFHDPLTRGWQEKIDALVVRTQAPAG